jgi:SPP1 family predicted phage head-tail adaptor
LLFRHLAFAPHWPVSAKEVHSGMTQAADLKHRLTFQKEVATPDPYGGSTYVWTDQLTVWGSIIFRTGSETVIAQRLQGIQPVTVRVRYSAQTKAIEASWRIKHQRGDGVVDYYAVKSPPVRKPDDYGFLLLEAVMGAADGGAG